MRHPRFLAAGSLFGALAVTAAARPAHADQVAQPLPFAQDWSNTLLWTADNDWSVIPGIEGYDGSDPNISSFSDPSTNCCIVGALSVSLHRTNPNSPGPPVTGLAGVVEFDITDRVVALRGDPTHDYPQLILYLNTTGKKNIVLSCNARDIDGGPNNAASALEIQYRVGSSGGFFDVLGLGDVAVGPNTTTVTPVVAALPAAANNVPLLEVRIMTGNASGLDEFVGIDDIAVTGDDIPTGVGSAPPGLSLRLVGSPNPFDATTEFDFGLARAAPATLEVFDVRGRLVRTLVSSSLAPGEHAQSWDGTDRNGRPVLGGVYFAVLRVGGRSETTKIIRVR